MRRARCIAGASWWRGVRVAQHADDVVDVVERVRGRERQRQHLPGGELGVRQTQIGIARRYQVSSCTARKCRPEPISASVSASA